MLFQHIHDAGGLAGLYLFLLLSGVGVYLVLSGLSYRYFFVWRRERYHPQYRPERATLLRSMKWAFYSAAGNAALVALLELVIIRGGSRIYYDVDEHGWGYLVASAVLVLVFAESSIYWIHRALHTPFLYRHLHVHHHQFREPTPFASVAFHPLDSFFQAAPYHLCALLLPLHVWVYHGFVVAATFWAVAIHDRVRLVGSEWINHTGCHMVHHWYFAHNYGQYFTFWDRLCGTYRRSDCLPDRFASSWPKGHTGESGA